MLISKTYNTLKIDRNLVESTKENMIVILKYLKVLIDDSQTDKLFFDLNLKGQFYH